jgi:hypothetical protein
MFASIDFFFSAPTGRAKIIIAIKRQKTSAARKKMAGLINGKKLMVYYEEEKLPTTAVFS